MSADDKSVSRSHPPPPIPLFLSAAIRAVGVCDSRRTTGCLCGGGGGRLVGGSGGRVCLGLFTTTPPHPRRSPTLAISPPRCPRPAQRACSPPPQRHPLSPHSTRGRVRVSSSRGAELNNKKPQKTDLKMSPIIRGAGLLALCAGALAGYPSPPAYPTKVYVTASINSISRIDAVDSSFQMDFYLVFAWRDDRLFPQIDQELDPATQFHPSPEIINVGAFGLGDAGRRAPTRWWAAAARPRFRGGRSRNAIIMCWGQRAIRRSSTRPPSPPPLRSRLAQPGLREAKLDHRQRSGIRVGQAGPAPAPADRTISRPPIPPPPLGSAAGSVSGTRGRRAPCFMREHSRHSRII
jgi:hypothetical protein